MANRLLFIYNVASSLPAGALSVVRKQIGRPQCDLCSITYGIVRKKAQWADAERRLPFPAAYYHKDDLPPPIRGFLRGQRLELPVVLLDQDSSFSFVAEKTDIANCRGSVSCLEKKIAAYFQSHISGAIMTEDMHNAMPEAHVQHPKLDYHFIADGVFIGTNQCCQAHFDEKLLKDGIEADMSLEEERIDAPFGVKFYVWVPIKNHAAPSPEKLEFGVAVLEKWADMGVKVYLHCQNGHGRAPTMFAAYLIKRHKKSIEEAIAFIRERRPAIHLEDVQRGALVAYAARVISRQ